MDEVMVKNAARSSGLEEATCRDLLRKGWTLVLEINQPSRWLDPSASLPHRITPKES